MKKKTHLLVMGVVCVFWNQVTWAQEASAETDCKSLIRNYSTAAMGISPLGYKLVQEITEANIHHSTLFKRYQLDKHDLYDFFGKAQNASDSKPSRVLPRTTEKFGETLMRAKKDLIQEVNSIKEFLTKESYKEALDEIEHSFRHVVLEGGKFKFLPPSHTAAKEALFKMASVVQSKQHLMRLEQVLFQIKLSRVSRGVSTSPVLKNFSLPKRAALNVFTKYGLKKLLIGGAVLFTAPAFLVAIGTEAAAATFMSPSTSPAGKLAENPEILLKLPEKDACLLLERHPFLKGKVQEITQSLFDEQEEKLERLVRAARADAYVSESQKKFPFAARKDVSLKNALAGAKQLNVRSAQ